MTWRDRENQSRAEYDNYRQELASERTQLVGFRTEVAKMMRHVNDLDALHEEYAAGTRSTAVVLDDRLALTSVSDIALERMRNRARGITTALTPAEVLESLRERVESLGSGDRTLEEMGSYFTRESSVYLGSSMMPTFGSVNRRTVKAPRERAKRPDSAPTTAQPQGENGETLSNIERIQKDVQNRVLKALIDREASTNWQPVLLAELCYNYRFELFLENYVAACELLKDYKMWLGAAEGEPVVGSEENRKRYLETTSDPLGPDPSIDVSRPAKDAPREQVNLNLNMAVLRELRSKYKLNVMVKVNQYKPGTHVRFDSDEEDAPEVQYGPTNGFSTNH